MKLTINQLGSTCTWYDFFIHHVNIPPLNMARQFQGLICFENSVYIAICKNALHSLVFFYLKDDIFC